MSNSREILNLLTDLRDDGAEATSVRTRLQTVFPSTDPQYAGLQPEKVDRASRGGTYTFYKYTDDQEERITTALRDKLKNDPAYMSDLNARYLAVVNSANPSDAAIQELRQEFETLNGENPDQSWFGISWKNSGRAGTGMSTDGKEALATAYTSFTGSPPPTGAAPAPTGDGATAPTVDGAGTGGAEGATTGAGAGETTPAAQGTIASVIGDGASVKEFSEDVRNVQAMINLMNGDCGPVDGRSGSLTVAGITKWANEQEPKIDVTKMSWADFVKAVEEKAQASPHVHQNVENALGSDDKNKIRAAQVWMNIHGGELKVDGVVGDLTRAEAAEQQFKIGSGEAAPAPVPPAPTPAAPAPVIGPPP